MNISDTYSDGDFVPPMWERGGFKEVDASDMPVGYHSISLRFDCECDHTNTNRDGFCTICGGAVQEDARRCDWIFLLPCFGLMLLTLWAALFLKR
jgi:hypothetical protein